MHASSSKDLSLQVHDQEGTAYAVRFAVEERVEKGTLVIMTATGEVTQRYELAQMKKSPDGTTLTCQVSGATVMVTLKKDKGTPTLQVVATFIWPIFDAAYRLSEAEHQRLRAWIKDLRIGIQA